MKFLTYLFLYLCIAGFNSPLFSSSSSINSSEYKTALSCLEERGEVILEFYIADLSLLDELSKFISIDKVEGHNVEAYANKEGYNKFLKQNLPFNVLTPWIGKANKSLMPDRNKDGKLEINGYPDSFDNYVEIMNNFAKDYPDMCEILTIGQSVNGKDILFAHLGDSIKRDEAEPEIIVTATIHGDETLPYYEMLCLIDFLLTNYGTNEYATLILDSIDLWINPLHNPDGTFPQGNTFNLSATHRQNSNGTDLNRNYPTPGEKIETRHEPEVDAMIAFEDKHNFTIGMDLHTGMLAVIKPWAYNQQKSFEDDWFDYYANIFASEVQGVNVINPSYPGDGTRIDYPYYFQRCRNLETEIRSAKQCPENSLSDYWEKEKNGYLQVFKNVLNSLRGTVTDWKTGKGIMAKIFVEKWDKDWSFVYSHEGNGDYYRPIAKGEYDVTFSCDGYQSQTISGVKVSTGTPTIVDVALVPEGIGIIPNFQNSISKKFSISQNNGIIHISRKNAENNADIFIYDLKGSMVTNFIMQKGNKNMSCNAFNNKSVKSGNGTYIIQVKENNEGFSRQLIFLQ